MVSSALRLCRLRPLNVTDDIARALKAPSTLYPVKDSVHVRPACAGGNYIPIVLETPPTANSSTALLLRDRTFMFWLRFGMTILPLTILLWSAIRRGSEPLFHRVKRLLQPFMAADGRTGYFPLLMVELAQLATVDSDVRAVLQRGMFWSDTGLPNSNQASDEKGEQAQQGHKNPGRLNTARSHDSARMESILGSGSRQRMANVLALPVSAPRIRSRRHREAEVESLAQLLHDGKVLTLVPDRTGGPRGLDGLPLSVDCETYLENGLRLTLAHVQKFKDCTTPPFEGNSLPERKRWTLELPSPAAQPKKQDGENISGDLPSAPKQGQPSNELPGTAEGKPAPATRKRRKRAKKSATVRLPVEVETLMPGEDESSGEDLARGEEESEESMM